MIQQPLISVILPTYNNEAFLRDALSSILRQTYKNLEIIAIDDFSSDKSFEILKQFVKEDKRLKISRNVKRYGMTMTLNRALRNTKGKFIAFMNAQDINHPDRLNQQFAYLTAHEKVVAVGTQCIYLDSENKKTGKSEFPTENISIYKKPVNGLTLQFENMLLNKYRLPKDLLKFRTNKQHFLYADICIKLLQYGEIANLHKYLYFHRKTATMYEPNESMISIAKLWFRSIFIHDQMPSLKSLLLGNLKLN